MTQNDQTIRWLVGLAEACREDATTLRAAAGHAWCDMPLRAAMTRLAHERDGFSHDLLAAASRLGDAVEAKTGPAGALYRHRFGDTSRGADPGDATLGAEALIEAYDALVSQPLPDSLRGLVERQFESVVVSLEILWNAVREVHQERQLMAA
jgi:hypothetical protein